VCRQLVRRRSVACTTTSGWKKRSGSSTRARWSVTVEGRWSGEPSPAGDWARHVLCINGLIDNQVGALRKRQVVGSLRAGCGRVPSASPFVMAQL
jgi:hypothetical protein